MRTKVLGAVIAASVGFAGCGGGGSDSSGCPEGGQGSIQLEYSGLPAGGSGPVELTHGTEGKRVTAAGHQEGLPAGLWKVSPQPTAGGDGLVRTAYDAPPTEVCVRDGEMATVGIAWAKVPSSARLWSATINGEGSVVALDQAQLGPSGTASSAMVLKSKPAINRAQGLAFDRRGNLWVADPGGTLKRFPAGSLDSSGELEPDPIVGGITLNGGTPGPQGLAFDQEGNLWVSIAWSRQVVRYTPEQLSARGAPVPEVVINGFSSPKGLAFDASGNLWVADGSLVVKLEKSRLGASGGTSDAWSLSIIDSGPGSNVLEGASDLAFDRAGNLWISFFASNVIASVPPPGREESGVQLSVTVSSLLGGLVFDEAGGLWSPHGSGQLGRFSPAQLASSGDVSPEVTLENADVGTPSWLATYPAPAGLPLYHSLP